MSVSLMPWTVAARASLVDHLHVGGAQGVAADLQQVGLRTVITQYRIDDKRAAVAGIVARHQKAPPLRQTRRCLRCRVPPCRIEAAQLQRASLVHAVVEAVPNTLCVLTQRTVGDRGAAGKAAVFARKNQRAIARLGQASTTQQGLCDGKGVCGIVNVQATTSRLQVMARAVDVIVLPVTCSVPPLNVNPPAASPRFSSFETESVPRVRVVPPE